MLVFLKVLLIIVFLTVAFQDLRSRLFYAFLPLVIAGLGIGILFYSQNSENAWFVLKTNAIFIGLILILSSLILIMKYGSFDDVKESFGLGDVLILLAIIPLFSPMLLRLIFLSSAVSGLLLVLIYKRVRQINEVRLPFAGLLSLVCSVMLVLDMIEVIGLYDLVEL